MSVTSRQRLLEKLRHKEYRQAYAEESVKTSLPFQIKAIRKNRQFSQHELGVQASGMSQNAISRLESAEYGNLSINTLLRLAKAFDCALLVKFVSFSRLLREFEDLSEGALMADKFEKDLVELEDWRDGINRTIDSSEPRLTRDSSSFNFSESGEIRSPITFHESEHVFNLSSYQ